jgi:hypothetical protein
MPNATTVPLAYRDATGTTHRVLTRQNRDGAWQVLDITVIETLTGDGEGREAAEAIARDYAEQHDHPAAYRAAEQPAAV